MTHLGGIKKQDVTGMHMQLALQAVHTLPLFLHQHQLLHRSTQEHIQQLHQQLNVRNSSSSKQDASPEHLGNQCHK